ncbi:MAG: biotin carboxylase, partial [Lachnospiraceae bacterium]|nr:biotin carboxylase [Lachnospiraceae bacterium]
GKEGVIKGIEIDPALSQMEGVEEVAVYKKEGETVHGTKSSNDRLGHIITVGATAEEAMEIGRRAMELVRVEVE